MIRGALLSTVMAGCAWQTCAQPVDPAQRLDALERALANQADLLAAQQKLIEAQRAEIGQLRAQVEGDSAARLTQLETEARQSRLKEQDQPRMSLQAGRPTVSSPDGRFSFSPRLVVQLDAAYYDQAKARPLASDFRRGSVAGGRENSAARDLSNGANFRRARLGFEGTFNRDFGFRFVGEFGGSGTEGPARVNDAFLSYTGIAPFTFQLGAFSPPANMDDGTGVEDSLFIERATPAELSRALAGADGRIGLGVRHAGTHWFGAATLTTRTVNDTEVNDSQAAVVGRLAHLLYTSDEANVHLGISGTYVFKPADQGPDAATNAIRTPMRLRDRPELRVDSTRLIDTGPIDAEGAYVGGIEFGSNWRSLFLQGEYFRYGISRRADFGTVNFSGWYVEGAWVLTGERRRYSIANGSFGAPRAIAPFTSAGGIGAWELALRYSRTNLNDNPGLSGQAPPPGGVRGGEQSILGVGVNWFLSSNARMSFNYLNVDVDRLNPAGPGNLTPFGTGPATPPIGAEIGQTLDIYALRLQYGF